MNSGQAAELLIIGVGNEYRGDDGVGRQVVRTIAELGLPNVAIREESGEGAALIDSWGGYKRVFAIDATRSGNSPGKIHRLSANDGPIPAEFFHYSTHAFSLAEAVELARALGLLPPDLVIYGIEGASFAAGTSLSEPVARAAVELVDRLQVEIAARGGAPRVPTSP